jgi:Uma2 family endonuclease
MTTTDTSLPHGYSPSLSLGPYRAGDYAALPEDSRCELLYGRYVMSPSPVVLHQLVVSLLWKALDEIARGAGGLALASPIDVHFAEHSIVQPDVLYVSSQRRDIVQDWVQGAPDLVVEVLSHGTTRRDRVDKLKLYSDHNVAEYWIVDPTSQQIDFLINENGAFQVALAEADVYRSKAIAEITLNLHEFWQSVAARLDRSAS